MTVQELIDALTELKLPNAQVRDVTGNEITEVVADGDIVELFAAGRLSTF